MSSSRHVQTVKDIYSAFAQGRIADILDRLSDDVVWIQPGGPEIPWSGTATCKGDVATFFVKLDAAAAIDEFEPREYVGDADTVVALGFWSGKSKTAGKPFCSDWSMTWKFRDDKVAYYQAFLDTSTLAKQF
jgi:ketosteroid isomerase-like protein